MSTQNLQTPQEEDSQGQTSHDKVPPASQSHDLGATRQRAPTSLGREFTIDTKRRNLVQTEKLLRKKFENVEIAITDCTDPTRLRLERTELRDLKNKFVEIARQLIDLNHEDEALSLQITQFEDITYDLIKRIGEVLLEIESETKSRLTTSSRRSYKQRSISNLENRLQLINEGIATSKELAELQTSANEDLSDLPTDTPQERTGRYIYTLQDVPNTSEVVSTPNTPEVVSTPNVSAFVSIPNVSEVVSTPNVSAFVSIPNVSEVVSTPNTSAFVSTSNVSTRVSAPRTSMLACYTTSLNSRSTPSRFISNTPLTSNSSGIYTNTTLASGSLMSLHLQKQTTKQEHKPEEDSVRNQKHTPEEESTRLLSSLTGLWHQSRFPVPEPPVFSGDPLEYAGWRSAFEILIENKGIPSAEKIHYLKRYLQGKARESVENLFLLSTEDAYKEAKRVLDNRYGDMFTVANAFREKISKWPKIAPTDGEALRRFSDFLKQCLAASRTVKSLSILDDVHENLKLQEKLPNWLLNRWAVKISEHQRGGNFPSFETFVDFLSKEADIACNPCVYTNFAKKNGEDRHKVQRRTGTTFTTNHSEPVKSTNENHKSNPVTTNRSGPTNENRKSCRMCGSSHWLGHCPDFLKLPVGERNNYAKTSKLCFNCLAYGHPSFKCKSNFRCKTCDKSHATPLHPNDNDSGASANPTQEPAEDRDRPISDSIIATPKVSNHVNLAVNSFSKTAMIIPLYISQVVDGKSTQERLVYGMLDSQSDATYILENTARDIGARGEEVKFSLSTMSTLNEEVKAREIAGLRVRGLNRPTFIQLPVAYTRPGIPINRTHIPTQETAKRYPYLQHLAGEMAPLLDVEVGILIGYDCSEALFPVSVVPPVDQGPFAQESILGWGIIGGEINSNTSHTCFKTNSYIVQDSRTRMESSEDLSKLLVSDLGGLDSDMNKVSMDDRHFLDQLTRGIHKTEDGHYSMPLPFRSKCVAMPDNRELAEKRLSHLKRRLLNDSTYREHYCEFMNEIISQGHAELAPTHHTQGKLNYIPHHGVYNPKKPGKIRVVFDCSARWEGTSINDVLLQGPDQINALLGIIHRFRKHKVAICCDIERMFYNFLVDDRDRDFLRFLWWPDGNLNVQPEEYRMRVHLFGATSSPGCACFGLKQAAVDGMEKYGHEASDFVTKDFYIDDGIKSVETEDNAIKLIRNTVSLCQDAGIHLHKFASNSEVVMESVPENERAKNLVNLDLSQVERVLGVEWHIKSDTFRYKIVLKSQPLTRRGILSELSQIYDPVGFLAPVVLRGREILQDCCKLQLSWDAQLPENLASRWALWRDELTSLDALQVRRCFTPDHFGEIQSIQLHTFCDASYEGYGVCSYLRFVNVAGKIHCVLVSSKARVTPLKQISIPRLELTAAVLATQISAFLRKELSYDHLTEFFWSDSQCVLAYIANNAKRFHVFVANRIQKIHDYTSPTQWNYVPSGENPADIASRGMSAKHIIDSSLWFQGPAFLWNEELPKGNPLPEIEETNVELKQTASFATSIKTQPEPFWCRYSSYNHLIRVISNCKKYLQLWRSRVKSETLCKLPEPDMNIKVEDLQEAELVLIKLTQLEAFPEEIRILQSTSNRKQLKRKSALYKLNPILDERGIIRVGGRINEDLNDTQAYPVVLPHKSHLSKLIVRQYHELNHLGRNYTINLILQAGYWILMCRKLTNSILNECVVCRRCRRPQETQRMSTLPTSRIEETPPFTYVGVDCFGPFTIREKRSDLKKYGVLFTCLMCRAIHLEVVSSLETDAFINAIRRFTAIRGPIRELYCDQGSNFVGAANEFKRAFDEMDQDKLKSELLSHGCDFFPFKFNVPHASHMGGIWERQIGTVRKVLQPIMLNTSKQLDDEGLRTVFYEIMAIVNSRPLAVDDLTDPTSSLPLTPNNLLTMKTSVILPPPGVFPEADLYSRKRWRRVQHILNLFWQRWRYEYVQTLQIRQKWTHQQPNITIGDIVLVKDNNLPRNQWPLARVVEVMPSGDGLVRKVKVRLSNRSIDMTGKPTKQCSYFDRPIHKLVLILKANNSS